MLLSRVFARALRSRLNQARALALLLVLGLAIDALVVEPSALDVTHAAIETPALPPIRIAALSDLHAGARFIDLDKIREIVRRTNDAHPDLIVLLGDYLNNGHGHDGLRIKGGHLDPEPVAAELGRLSAPLGVHAVLGNHDHWFGSDRIERALEHEGIHVIDNGAVPIDVQGHARFWLAGLADASEHRTDLELALADVPGAEPVLAITHSPDAFVHLPAHVALTLAGHTHGGQVALPWIGALLVPSEHGRRYARGVVREDGRTLFVTSGIGTSIYPVRFGVRPEIAIIDTRERTILPEKGLKSAARPSAAPPDDSSAAQ